MDVVKEDIENRTIYFSTPIREKHIKVFWPRELNAGMWRITYDDGTTVDKSLSGAFTTKSFAVKALEQWEGTTKPTPQARYKDKVPPKLERKQIASSGKNS